MDPIQSNPQPSSKNQSQAQDAWDGKTFQPDLSTSMNAPTTNIIRQYHLPTLSDSPNGPTSQRNEKNGKSLNSQIREPQMIEKLVALWERSVISTHLFLSPSQILQIKDYVPQALQEIPHLIVSFDENDIPTGFMGFVEGKMEMLFVDSDKHGQGIGKQLVQLGITQHNITEVTVNEQNPQAKGFYEHMGFVVYKRSELDEQGQPFPILYMKR